MWRWLMGQGGGRGRSVVLYTRAGCCLCDQAWKVLQNAQRRHAFSLGKIDVDTDPVLAESYGLQVPVVTVDGRVCFRGTVNTVLLDRIFARGNILDEKK
jgi:hypothetical protein